MRKFKQTCTNIIKQLNIQISVGRYFPSKRQYIQWIPGWTWCCRQWSMQRLDPKQYHWRSLDMPSFQSEHRVQYQLSSHQPAVGREMNHVISKQNFTKINKCLKLSEIRWTVPVGYRMVPQNMWVSENVGPILKPQQHLWLVSKSCFRVTLCLRVSNLFYVLVNSSNVSNYKTGVSKSCKVLNLPFNTPYQGEKETWSKMETS